MITLKQSLMDTKCNVLNILFFFLYLPLSIPSDWANKTELKKYIALRAQKYLARYYSSTRKWRSKEASNVIVRDWEGISVRSGNFRSGEI